MSDTTFPSLEPAPLCEDCKTELSGNAVDHGLEGFGHQGVCCACYEHRIRFGKKRPTG